MRRLIQVAASISCAALVASCGGAPEASTPPAATSEAPNASDTPVPSDPDPRPPNKPIEVTEKDANGARAASRFFLEALNYAGVSGDTSLLRQAYTDFCTRCEALADGIDETYGNGGQIFGEGWIPQDYEFYGIKEDIAFVDVIVDVSPQEWVESEGAQPVEAPGDDSVLKAFQLDWGADGWMVAALDPDT